jgi:hypothetical protein
MCVLLRHTIKENAGHVTNVSQIFSKKIYFFPQRAEKERKNGKKGISGIRKLPLECLSFSDLTFSPNVSFRLLQMCNLKSGFYFSTYGTTALSDLFPYTAEGI